MLGWGRPEDFHRAVRRTQQNPVLWWICSKFESLSGRRSSHSDVSRNGEARAFIIRLTMIEIESVSVVLRIYSVLSAREATFP